MSAMRRRRGRAILRPVPDPDLDRALEAMTAPELRSLVRSVLDGLEDEQRSAIVDSLVARAARGEAGWRPSRSSHESSTRSSCLPKPLGTSVTRIPMTSEHICAREPRHFWPVIMRTPGSYSRHSFHPSHTATSMSVINEMVEDVLNVDVRATVAQYVTSVYTPTPLGERAKAVCDAIERVAGFASLATSALRSRGNARGLLPGVRAEGRRAGIHGLDSRRAAAVFTSPCVQRRTDARDGGPRRIRGWVTRN